MCCARDNAKRAQEEFYCFLRKKNLHALSFDKFLVNLQYHSQ